MSILREDQYIFSIISRSVLLRMRNVSDKRYTGNRDTHDVFSNFFFFNRAVYEITWKNIAEWILPQMTIWCMLISGNTHNQRI
jgi:hypothetical protein